MNWRASKASARRMLFGGGDYAMRVWIDPDKAAARGLTGGDMVNAMREQNLQVSAGTIGAPPQPGGADCSSRSTPQGRLDTGGVRRDRAQDRAETVSSPGSRRRARRARRLRAIRCARCSTTTTPPRS
jgi:multidrug efflux pump subunit AcrB